MAHSSGGRLAGRPVGGWTSHRKNAPFLYFHTTRDTTSGLRVTQFSILAAVARLGEASLKQLEAELAIDQTTLTRSLTLLERDGVLERASHPDGRFKAMRLTSKGRRALEVARPLWAQAQGKVLRELGTKAWADAQRQLTRLHHVAVKKRQLGRDWRRRRPSGRRAVD